jgi:hypothetical protein
VHTGHTASAELAPAAVVVEVAEVAEVAESAVPSDERSERIARSEDDGEYDNAALLHAELADDGPGTSPLDAALDSASPGDIRTEPGDTPSFVRAADRAARWRTPRVRAALAVASLVAAAALAAQWGIAQRDLVAARSPALKPLLASACATLGCTLHAPRAIEALRVESSGLVRVEKSDLYRLNVALRNLRTHDVALPALELALTDTQGQLIARRVLRAGELGVRSEALAGSAELTLQSTVQVSGSIVAGYTIELFYP